MKTSSLVHVPRQRRRCAPSLTSLVLMGVLSIGCGTESSQGMRTATTPSESVSKSALATAKEAPKKQSAAQRFGVECREGLVAAKRALPALLAVGGTRDLQNLLRPYNRMLVDVERSTAIAGLMSAVHPDQAIRNEARACEQEASSFTSELSLNQKLYEAFLAVSTAELDAKAKRFVATTLRDYRRAGVDKSEAIRHRLKKIDEAMVVLGQAFAKNIVDDVRHIELSSVEQLAGLPLDYIKSHIPNKGGKIVITTDYPDLQPFLKYADNDDLRKQLYVAFKSRASEVNEVVLRKLLTLRAEKAKILGFANWADYITADKMMKSGDNAAKFIDRVVKTAQSRAKEDYKELLAWKRKHMDKRAKSVDDWQKTYIENKVKAQNYSFDTQEVRPYFRYEDVQRGLLDITSQMYGIEYVPAPNVVTWFSDVSVFEVMREGKKIGRIFLDMHPRDGKYGHAAQFPMRSGVAGIQLPVGALVCNFPNPRTSVGPALMEHAQVTTMFHEFGHLMHHILGGNQQWILQSGVSTEWDFVEAPSQMFEEWAWDPAVLATFAKHYESGKVIPAEMVERMRKADKFGVGLRTLQQMFYASISLQFHQADPSTLDMGALVKKLQAKLTPFAFVDGTKFYSNFGHLNGYSAIYYTYMWSMVIAKDLFTPFAKNGLMNLEWTHKYRDVILAAGGTKDAADLVSDFLGREFNFKAFEKYLRK